MKPEERDELIDSLLDDAISEADFLRLEAEMHIDTEVRQAYYERLKLDTNLQIAAESEGEADSELASAISKNSTPIGWLGWAAAVVLGLLALVLGLEIRRTNQAIAGGSNELIASGFGVIAEQSGASWNLERGDLLPQGTVSLEAGMAELELFSGVTITVEGPAKFEIVSASLIQASKGNFFVQKPRMVGDFRLKTATGEIFDIDSELALEIDNDGKGISHQKGGAIRQQMATHRAEQEQKWLASVSELKRDPRLIAYFPIIDEPDWSRQLIDHSAEKRNGTIVRATRVLNRWGHPSGGLDFTPTGSRVRLEIPGDHSSLTLMCWVKIDSLDRWYNSLFLTDGHELYEPHWQIMDDGRLFFSVKANEPGKKGKDKHIAYSLPIWTPADSGKWMHIATVFDGNVMTTTHFVNGKMISRDEIPEAMQPDKVRIGTASIGNWSDPTRGEDPHFAVRNLNGTIDEFAIFSEPLTDSEIAEIYENGKP
ncbi:MAG: LamG-like jellyroll fold domain-containing protein [Verrucomicrobiales bacterium]